MAYIVTEDDFNIIKQSTQEVYIKIELCNKSLKVLDSMEGSIINDSYHQTNESQQRRSYQCDFVVTDTSFILGRDKKIWLDKRLRIYYGLRSLRNNEIVWYLIGTFVYVDMDYSFTGTDRTVSISCADLMAEYDGTLNGQLSGYGSSNNSEYATQGLKIPAGEDIRSSIIAILKDAGISRYIVEDIEKEIPYDLEFQTGVTYAEIWQKVSELYDSWEFFFDPDGTFIWQKIPTCLEDNVVLDNSFFKELFVSEKVSASFSGIYNVTEVWGKVLELSNDDRYTETSAYSNNTYQITLDGYASWDDIDNLTKIGFKTSAANLDNPYFSVNNYSSIPIVDGDGVPLTAGALKKDTVYVFRYRRVGVDSSGISSTLYLLGQFQCYGIYKEDSEECPFSVPNLGYEIKRSLDYESLSDDAACYNQAEYLTYSTTAMMDTITLTLPVIPWLEVNQKIEYQPEYDLSTDDTNQYIVKDISWSTGQGTMNLTLYKFLESFSYVYKRKEK